MRPKDRSPGPQACNTLTVEKPPAAQIQEHPMLQYAVVFFVIALIAAVLGFGGIAIGAASIARGLFFLFAILAIATFLFGLIRKN
jgi:uncharacterized membrane protein YtjA (UPF0391 family)